MVWFRSSAPDWPYYTQCSTIPQIPLAKGSERVSGWRREMASNHRYPALRQVLYPAKLSLHDGGSSPPNSVTQTGSRRTESRRVPGAEDDFHASPVSAQMKPCDQDWGKENLDVSGAVPLPENNCIIPYMWYPVNEKTQYIVCLNCKQTLRYHYI